jgi:transcription antitermination factor NusG
MIDAAWYAVAVRSNFERIVGNSLRQKDYEVFLPTYLSKRRWSDRTKVVECALFPGYVFCRMDLRRRIPLLDTPGVASIVGVGKCAVPVRDSEIAAIPKTCRIGFADIALAVPQGRAVRLHQSGPVGRRGGHLSRHQESQPACGIRGNAAALGDGGD